MKRKLILPLACCVLVLVVGIGGAIMCFGKSERDPEIKIGVPHVGTLYVNSQRIATEHVVIYTAYVELPLVKILEGLGFDVEWVDDNTADITYNDKKYVLNLSEASLVEDGKTGNYIIPAPGNRTFRCKAVEKDLILDGNTVFNILYFIKRVNIRTDRNHLIVNIFDRAD